MSGEAAQRLDGDFTVSLSLEVPADRAGAAGGLVSKFDPATRRGFNLSAISSAGGYNGPGDELRISFGIDAGSEPRWFDSRAAVSGVELREQLAHRLRGVALRGDFGCARRG